MAKSIARKTNLNRTFIREWRKHRRLSLDRLAPRIPMAVSSLSRVERGVQPYSQPMLEAIAEALGCAPADLLMRNPLEEADPRVQDLLNSLDEQERNYVRGYIEALIQRRA